MAFKIDHIAREVALRHFALPECLHVPIAALDADVIATYIGDIVEELARGSPSKAFLVEVKKPPPIDDRLPIWDVEASGIFHRQKQVWVHVNYTRYRAAYRKALPKENIKGKVLSHAMSRRVAALKGFQYVRITPTSRGANSSSAFTENWSVAHHGAPGRTPAQARRNAFIQYADLCDLMLMMDIKLGGGIQTVVNEGQALVAPRA